MFESLEEAADSDIYTSYPTQTESIEGLTQTVTGATQYIPDDSDDDATQTQPYPYSDSISLPLVSNRPRTPARRRVQTATVGVQTDWTNKSLVHDLSQSTT